LAKVLTLVLAQKQFVPQCKDFPTQYERSTLQLKITEWFMLWSHVQLTFLTL